MTVVIALLALLVGIGIGQRLSSRKWMREIEPLRAFTERIATGAHAERPNAETSRDLQPLATALDKAAKRVSEVAQTHVVDEAQQRTLLDAMVEGVFVTDHEGKITLQNAALSRLAGPSAIGKTTVEIIRSAPLHDAVTGALRGDPASVQIQLGNAADPRTLAAQVAPLPNRKGAVVVLHDVTDLKLADTVRRDFVANASHELRTPLTAIRGFAETLSDGALKDPTVSKRFVDRILEHAVRLQRLVDDMLELSRAEAPDVRPSLEAVDISSVLGRVLHGFESLAIEKKLSLDLEPVPPGLRARADEKMLEHVIVNLVDNAVKYTQEGGVTVKASADDISVFIEVTDTGGGIAPSHLPRIFERFYRVDPGRARAVGGTGLGLAIVKHLSQRMNGDVGVESKIGKGTTFRVRLTRAYENDSE